MTFTAALSRNSRKRGSMPFLHAANSAPHARFFDARTCYYGVPKVIDYSSGSDETEALA